MRSLEYPALMLAFECYKRYYGMFTVKRYSTARSGLKYAARIAASISALAKPMLSMLAIAASRSGPMVKAEGSLKLLGSDGCWAGAGEGVLGTFWVKDDDGTGAAGAAGV